MMDDLQIVIFRSDPVRSRSLTFGGIIELLSTAIPEIGVPIPLVPTNVLTKDFHILTYPPAVSRVAVVAEQLGLKYDYVHAATQTKILEYNFTDKDWLTAADLLPERYVGHWLVWGVNWLVLDSFKARGKMSPFDEWLDLRPRQGVLYENALREDTYRSLISLHNPITVQKVTGRWASNHPLQAETKPSSTDDKH